ncbi:MAG: methyltransferase [Acidimicrobiales bacterium]
MPELVERNTEAFGKPGVRFQALDLSEAELPPADLLVCKDVLQHWPNDWVSSFLERGRRPLPLHARHQRRGQRRLCS